MKYYFLKKKNAFIKRQSAVKSKVTRTIFRVLKISFLTDPARPVSQSEIPMYFITMLSIGFHRKRAKI